MASSNQGNQGNQGSQSNPASKDPGGTAGRGSAAMDPSKPGEIPSKGGKAAHESGPAHALTPEESREAARKGGASSGGSNPGSKR
jgi:general stress protein YciG